jgi:DNA-binding transcriptional MerR regulator
VLKIGQFARLAGVSVKTLRYYASIGILLPAHVDPISRYRYFHWGQLPDVALIRKLRDAGFTIREVQRWLDAIDSPLGRVATLETVGHRLELRVADDERRLRVLGQLLHDSCQAPQSLIRKPYECRLSAEPAYTVRDRGRLVGESVYRMFEQAEQLVARQGARSPRKPFLLFHGPSYPQTHNDVEVCVPIVPASINAVGGRLVEGAKRAAYQRYAGSYAGGSAILDGIKSWLRQENLQQIGPVRETYLRYGADLRGYDLPKSHLADCVNDYRTELLVSFE